MRLNLKVKIIGFGISLVALAVYVWLVKNWNWTALFIIYFDLFLLNELIKIDQYENPEYWEKPSYIFNKNFNVVYLLVASLIFIVLLALKSIIEIFI